MNWKMIAGGAGVVLFLGVCIYMGGTFVDESAVKPAGGQSAVSETPTKTVSSTAKVNKSKKPMAGTQKSGKKGGLLQRPTVNARTNIIISVSEKTTLDELQLGLDEENIDKVRAAARTLAKSSSPYVRSKVVESLRWFKQKALPDLRSMLNDADPEVAREASDAWQEAAGEIMDESLKAQELLDGMLKMTDVDTLREAIMGFYELEDSVALEHLRQLIVSGNPQAAAVAREGWDHVAGDPYSGPEAAQKVIDEKKKTQIL